MLHLFISVDHDDSDNFIKNLDHQKSLYALNDLKDAIDLDDYNDFKWSQNDLTDLSLEFNDF